ncbi:hypothetical protein C5167_009138 [Papaver somniferum]|uniref:Uncharacterized protein n=1 Tax=Papaver somniferum TaxID=3469 RepID=A0A4Y7K088_PAPSO|nr:hypothetical protein C5167_009138 [Papaver somniferum]
MDRDSSIESGVRKRKNIARKPMGRTKKPVMDIDPTTPEKARAANRKTDKAMDGHQKVPGQNSTMRPCK